MKASKWSLNVKKLLKLSIKIHLKSLQAKVKFEIVNERFPDKSIKFVYSYEFSKSDAVQGSDQFYQISVINF